MVDQSEYLAEGTEDNEMTSILLRIAKHSVPLKKQFEVSPSHIIDTWLLHLR